MNYVIQPEVAVLENGIATHAGWLLAYHADPITHEFTGSTYEYLQEGVGLPADSYPDAPENTDKDQAVIRHNDQWICLNDYRGQTIYSTENGIESTVDEIGDIPDGYTLLKPNSEFDKWNGKKWILDTEKQRKHNIDYAIFRKSQLMNESAEQISCIQDAIDTEIATEQEIKQLSEWKQYRVLLNRIDVEKAPDIDWPAKPTSE